MQKAHLNLKEKKIKRKRKKPTFGGRCPFFFMFWIFIRCFCPAGKYRYIVIDTVATVKQQVNMAMDMTTSQLLISSFLYNLFSISETVIFTYFPLPTKSQWFHLLPVCSVLLMLTTKLINNHTFWRICS